MPDPIACDKTGSRAHPCAATFRTVALSPKDRDRISQLETLVHRVRHANALVEQFAAAPKDAEQLAGSMRRTFNQLKMQFTTAGFDQLAIQFSSLEQLARRGMSHGPKSRQLREGLGNALRSMDIAKRTIMTSGKAPEKESE
jgi:hypothetical protein